jgi:DNA-binding response OmpR family regulator
MRILVVDPREGAARTLQHALQGQGYAVDVAHTAATGDEIAVVDHHDVIILVDVARGFDGAELCRELRGQGVTAPILIVSEETSTAAKISGLDAGADDYVTAPYVFAELLARLRSLLRRSRASEGAVLRAGDLVMDLREHEVTLAGTRVKLTAKEFALLEYMMRNPRRLLTRTMISESVWDMNYESASNVIDVYVSSLRRKVDTDPARPRIETVIGSGYRFVDPDQPAGAVRQAEPDS